MDICKPESIRINNQSLVPALHVPVDFTLGVNTPKPQVAPQFGLENSRDIQPNFFLCGFLKKYLVGGAPAD
jgi:hypothetical protein